jgi:hypothetical protein
MKNWIQGQSHTNDSGQLITSNFDISQVIENVKNIVTKEKVGKFKPQHRKDQLSTSLKIEEHRGRT